MVALLPLPAPVTREGRRGERQGEGRRQALYYASVTLWPICYVAPMAGTQIEVSAGGISHMDYFAWLVPLGDRMESNQGAERDVNTYLQ